MYVGLRNEYRQRLWQLLELVRKAERDQCLNDNWDPVVTDLWFGNTSSCCTNISTGPIGGAQTEFV